MHPSSDTRFNDGHLVTYFEPYCLEGFIVFYLNCRTRGFSFSRKIQYGWRFWLCDWGGFSKKHKTTPNDWKTKFTLIKKWYFLTDTISVNIESQSSHQTGKKEKQQQQRNKTRIRCYEELEAEIDVVIKVFNFKDHDKTRLFYHWGVW